MARIVVTGGAGMIGSNLVTGLASAGHDVVVIDDFSRGTKRNLDEAIATGGKPVEVVVADLSVPGDWAEHFAGADAVYHLADVVAGVGFVFDNEGAVFRQNLLINANVANAVAAKKPGRYIYVGTACSFPMEIQTGVDAPPMREEQQLPANPESGYGWSKLMGEFDAKYLHKQNDIPSVVLVLHNVYGTPCEFTGKKAQAIPAIIHRALTTDEGTLSVWGSGQQGRAFLHVSDVTRALLLALEKGEGQGPIQIGPNICTSIATIAETVVSLTDRGLQVEYDMTKPEGDRGRCADYSKATSVLGWKPEVELKHGLAATLSWIKERLDETEVDGAEAEGVRRSPNM